jgi:L-rhamnose isomerase
LDFFDASINRIAAWVIGARALQKALLGALLEPIDRMREFEAAGDFTGRLAVLEELKTMPLGAVWDFYCVKNNVPVEGCWMDAVKRYECEVLAKRS